MNADISQVSDVNAATPGHFAAGERLPVLSRHVTQRMIDDYAKASGDFNPMKTSKGRDEARVAYVQLGLGYLQ